MADPKQELLVASKRLMDARSRREEAEHEEQLAQADFDAVYDRISTLGSNKPATQEPPVPPSVPKPPTSSSGDTYASRIINCLRSQPNKAWSYAELESALPGINGQTLRTSLFRLKKYNAVQKAGHGEWKAMP
jgi:hypothetical protein